VIEAFAEHISFAERSYVDFKTELQEQLAKAGRSVSYRLVETIGPPHARQFVLDAVVDGQAVGRGVGASKKRAEQEAAAEALRELNSDDRPRRRRVRLRGRRRAAPAGGDGQTPVEGEAAGGEAGAGDVLAPPDVAGDAGRGADGLAGDASATDGGV